MEKRDAFLVFLGLAGLGYAGYANWDTIKEKLGLDDLYPGRIKAIDLAKRANSIDRYRANWEILQELEQGEEIQIVGDPWEAEAIHDQLYRVTCKFKQDGQPRRYVFEVNVATLAVKLLADQTGPAASAPLPAPR